MLQYTDRRVRSYYDKVEEKYFFSSLASLPHYSTMITVGRRLSACLFIVTTFAVLYADGFRARSLSRKMMHVHSNLEADAVFIAPFFSPLSHLKIVVSLIKRYFVPNFPISSYINQYVTPSE